MISAGHDETWDTSWWQPITEAGFGAYSAARRAQHAVPAPRMVPPARPPGRRADANT